MNLDELFNMDRSIENVSTEPVKKSVDENLYVINLGDAKDGVYKAKIRFIPNFRDIKKSIISKFTYWLTEANGENGIYVDDPSSVGEKSPIGDMYWKLKKSTNPIEVNLSDQLKRGKKCFSLVQILEDENHPELVGRIMVFSYGVKIKEKIDNEMNDADEGANPFDVLHGRTFRLEVKKVGGFPNYDNCRFIGGGGPIKIDGKETTDKKTIVNYLETSPELEKYDYKPWTAELTEQVNERLNTYKSGRQSKSVVEKAMKQETIDSYDDEDNGTSNEDEDFLAGINL